MLVKKKKLKSALSVVGKNPVKIIQMQKVIRRPDTTLTGNVRLSPQENEYNTRYIKGKDNDLL